MILADQFTNVPNNLILKFSSTKDGSVLDRTIESHAAHIVENRKNICVQAGLSYDDVVFQRIIYDERASYSIIAEVDVRSTSKFIPEVVADALFTKVPGIGMFLPVADCIVMVIYDQKHRFLAQLHMGRHSTLSDLLPRMLKKFASEGSSMSDLTVWMGPAASKQSYVLEYFDREFDRSWAEYINKTPDGYYIDMQGYNRSVCERAGISASSITISSIDTISNNNYYSHSRGDITKRFAGVVAMYDK